MGSQQHLGVTDVQAGEYAAAGGVLGRAFATDPLWTAILGDPERRPEMLARMFTGFSKAMATQGKAEKAADLSGVALWMPPGKELGVWAMVRSGFAISRFVMSLSSRERKLMLSTLREVDARKKALMPAPHWYIAAIGVEPERHGQGVGSALMHHGMARADRDEVPIYLETETESNVGFYRHLGFVVIEEFEPAQVSVPLWLMKRDAA